MTLEFRILTSVHAWTQGIHAARFAEGLHHIVVVLGWLWTPQRCSWRWCSHTKAFPKYTHEEVFLFLNVTILVHVMYPWNDTCISSSPRGTRQLFQIVILEGTTVQYPFLVIQTSTTSSGVLSKVGDDLFHLLGNEAAGVYSIAIEALLPWSKVFIIGTVFVNGLRVSCCGRTDIYIVIKIHESSNTSSLFWIVGMDTCFVLVSQSIFCHNLEHTNSFWGHVDSIYIWLIFNCNVSKAVLHLSEQHVKFDFMTSVDFGSESCLFILLSSFSFAWWPRHWILKDTKPVHWAKVWLGVKAQVCSCVLDLLVPYNADNSYEFNHSCKSDLAHKFVFLVGNLMNILFVVGPFTTWQAWKFPRVFQVSTQATNFTEVAQLVWNL